MSLLYGIAAVALLWWLGRFFAQTNAAAMARAMKVVGGLLCLGAAVLVGLRGRIDMALLIGGAGAWLLGWSLPFLPRWGAPTSQPTPGAVSRVRSALLEMELRHDSGELTGRVLAGAFAGQALAALDEAQLLRLMGECQAGDPDGIRLLEAYLDRRFPRWREDAQPDPDPGPRGRPQPGAMTEKEAYEILGLQPGAGIEEIRAAHRALMKKFHPDQGGTPYLAAKINEAKEILLSRHR